MKKEREKQEKKDMKALKSKPMKGSLRMGVSMMMLGRQRGILCRAQTPDELQAWLRALRQVYSHLERKNSDTHTQKPLDQNVHQVFLSDGSEDSKSDGESPDIETSPTNSATLSRNVSGIPAHGLPGSSGIPMSLSPKHQPSSSNQTSPLVSPRSNLRTSAKQPHLSLVTIGSRLDGQRGMAERIAVRGCAWRNWIPIMVHPGGQRPDPCVPTVVFWPLPACVRISCDSRCFFDHGLPTDLHHRHATRRCPG